MIKGSKPRNGKKCFFLSLPNVYIYYSTYSSHNTTMLQSINLRMYPYGLNTSKTFWSSKNLVHTFFLSFNPAAALRLRGDKTLRERTKKIGLNTKHSIFHDRTQSSICQYCDCLVMLCHSLYKKKNWKDFKVNFFLVQEVFSSKKEASTYIHTNFYIAPQHYT